VKTIKERGRCIVEEEAKRLMTLKQDHIEGVEESMTKLEEFVCKIQ